MSHKILIQTDYRIRWVEPPDGNWGAVDANGSWNGLVGQMQREVRALIKELIKS